MNNINHFIIILTIAELEEATEFNFDWSSNLQIKFGIIPDKNDLNNIYSHNPIRKYNQIVIHGKMEENYINGLVRIFGRVPVEKKNSCGSLISPGLSFVGRFENGIPTGVCWRGLIGGAWLYGIVDDIGEFTGDEIAYIYPDLNTALFGKFVNGTMVKKLHNFPSIK